MSNDSQKSNSNYNPTLSAPSTIKLSNVSEEQLYEVGMDNQSYEVLAQPEHQAPETLLYEMDSPTAISPRTPTVVSPNYGSITARSVVTRPIINDGVMNQNYSESELHSQSTNNETLYADGTIV